MSYRFIRLKPKWMFPKGECGACYPIPEDVLLLPLCRIFLSDTICYKDELR